MPGGKISLMKLWFLRNRLNEQNCECCYECGMNVVLPEITQLKTTNASRLWTNRFVLMHQCLKDTVLKCSCGQRLFLFQNAVFE